jgi:hypothetical protein
MSPRVISPPAGVSRGGSQPGGSTGALGFQRGQNVPFASSVVSVFRATPFSLAPGNRQMRLIVSSNTKPAMTATSFLRTLPNLACRLPGSRQVA